MSNVVEMLKEVVRILEEKEKKEKAVKVSSLNPGDVFKDRDGEEYIVLEHPEDGRTAVLKKGLMEEMQFGSSNDWRDSYIRQELNSTYLRSLEEKFGEENILVHTVDLFSMDGLDDYGKCQDKVSILTADEYRRYRKALEKANGAAVGDWWWLCTPDSTPSGGGSSYVRIVVSSGTLSNGTASGSSNAVRPFFILDSSALVFPEMEGEDE